jgi:phage gp29-like protein
VPRPADEDDIETAKSIVRDIGRGSQPGAVVPDSIELELVGPGGETSRGASGDNTVHKALIEMCNAEISKAVLGGTLTTEVGDGGGNRALGEVQALQQSDIARSLAAQFDAAVTSQLVRWIVELNFGADMLPLAPRYRTKCEPQEDMAAVADAFAVLVGTGLKVPEAWAYARFGIPAPMDDEPVIGGDVAQVEQEQPGAGEPTPADKDTAQTGEEQD